MDAALVTSHFCDKSESRLDVLNTENKVEAALVANVYQPWKAFWPLNGTEQPKIWRNSEFPEVLSWEFNANEPFDRPWRTWTRTTLAKEEASLYFHNKDNGDIEKQAISDTSRSSPYL
jgi:hypothetical protein